MPFHMRSTRLGLDFIGAHGRGCLEYQVRLQLWTCIQCWDYERLWGLEEFCHEPMENRVEGCDLKFMCLGAKLRRDGVVIVKLDKT